MRCKLGNCPLWWNYLRLSFNISSVSAIETVQHQMNQEDCYEYQTRLHTVYSTMWTQKTLPSHSLLSKRHVTSQYVCICNLIYARRNIQPPSLCWFTLNSQMLSSTVCICLILTIIKLGVINVEKRQSTASPVPSVLKLYITQIFYGHSLY